MTTAPNGSGRERALVIHPRRARTQGALGAQASQDRLEEAVRLAEALDLEVVGSFAVPLRQLAPSTFFGSGRVAEIAELRRDLECGLVVVDDALTPIQQRNLETAWGAKVIDRTGLILEIFARRARSADGRLQVELARLEYERSRLVRTWTHLERQRGGFGFLGGPGETQIEADRRLLGERIVKLRSDLESVRRTRQLQRKGRKRTPFPIVALVGYTNAGKSTLFNRLTEASVLAKDMLFATLDPTFRKLGLPSGRDAILSDTVGFVSDLPHELVEAFRATLDEVRDADLILHVRDIASPASDTQRDDVLAVLRQIGAGPESGKPVIEVWNKLDLVSEEDHGPLMEGARRLGHAAISAYSGEGIGALRDAINRRLNDHPEQAFRLDASDGEALAWLYRHGQVMGRDMTEAGVTVTARLSAQALSQFARLRPDAAVPAGQGGPDRA